jgi:hypothetical protein
MPFHQAIFRQYPAQGGIYVKQVREQDRDRYERGQHLDEALKAFEEDESRMQQSAARMMREIRDGARLPSLFHQFLNRLQAGFDLVMSELRSASGIKTPGAQTIEGEAEIVEMPARRLTKG